MEKLNQKNYDLILCDLKMPKMNGLDFFSKISDMHPEMAEKIVFTSGELDNEEDHEMLGRMGRPFIAKPMSLTTLQNLVLAFCPN